VSITLFCHLYDTYSRVMQMSKAAKTPTEKTIQNLKTPAGKDLRRAKEDTARAMLDASRDTFGTLVESFLATGGRRNPGGRRPWKGKGSACRISLAGLTGR
jgi:hypothetical protein